jgi:hypothetical protein
MINRAALLFHFILIIFSGIFPLASATDDGHSTWPTTTSCTTYTEFMLGTSCSDSSEYLSRFVDDPKAQGCDHPTSWDGSTHQITASTALPSPPPSATAPTLPSSSEQQKQQHQGTTTETAIEEPTYRNFALLKDGANIIASNKEAKKIADALDDDSDTFLKNECKARDKWVIIELSEVARVLQLELAQNELYSSRVKEFELYGRQTHPRSDSSADATKWPISNQWKGMGTFIAENAKGVQTFQIDQPRWARFVMIKFLSHYGVEPVCAINSISVFGKSAAEELEDQLLATEEELMAAGGHGVGDVGEEHVGDIGRGMGGQVSITPPPPPVGVPQIITNDGGVNVAVAGVEGEGEQAANIEHQQQVYLSETDPVGITLDNLDSNSLNNSSSNSGVGDAEVKDAVLVVNTGEYNRGGEAAIATQQQQQKQQQQDTVEAHHRDQATIKHDDKPPSGNSNNSNGGEVAEDQEAGTTPRVDTPSPPPTGGESAAQHTVTYKEQQQQQQQQPGSAPTSGVQTPSPPPPHPSPTAPPPTAVVQLPPHQHPSPSPIPTPYNKARPAGNSNTNNDNNALIIHDLEDLEDLPLSIQPSKSKSGSSVYDWLVQEIRGAKLQQRIQARAMAALQKNITSITENFRAQTVALLETVELLRYRQEGGGMEALVGDLVKEHLQTAFGEDFQEVWGRLRGAAKREQAGMSFLGALGGAYALSNPQLGGQVKGWMKKTLAVLIAANAAVALALHIQAAVSFGKF